MKNLRFIVLLLPLMVQITSCSSSKQLSGHWEGTGNQIDGQSWAVHLNYIDNEHISIDYPSLSCGGVWTILKENKKEIVFKEKIENGILRCDQGNEVYVNKIDENSIKVVYFLRSYDPEKPIAEAILYKSTEMNVGN